MSFLVPPHVQAREVHGEIVVLDALTNEFLGLNATGAVVWSMLADGGSVEGAAEELVMRFDVSREVAARDVAALLDQLLGLGLLVRNDR